MNRENDYKEKGIEVLYKSSNHFWYHHRNKIILDSIMKYCKKAKEDTYLLELGAGSGNIALFLKCKGFKIDASDMYDSALKYFEGRVDNTFIYNITLGYIPDKFKHRYDVVILGDVIEHLHEPVSALKKCSDFLKAGGLILLTVPALMQLWTPYDQFAGHKKRWDKEGLEMELKESAYQIEEIKYFMFIPAIILFFKRRLKSIFFKYEEEEFKNELVISSIANRIMKLIMVMEYLIGRFIDFPFGSSLLALVRK